MSEFEWPSNDRDDVQHRARPKNKNDEQSGEDIRPKHQAPLGDNRVGIFDQNSERDALDDTDERQLDLDDHRIHFGARGGEFHQRSSSRYGSFDWNEVNSFSASSALLASPCEWARIAAACA